MAKKAPKEKKLRTWKFGKSQSLLLNEQARIHQTELNPFLAYQERSRNDLLNSFREELGIPDGLPLTVQLDKRRFVEREPDPRQVPPPPPPVEEKPKKKKPRKTPKKPKK